MAHQVETMAYANEVPWHGLGANVHEDATPEEFLKAAGLDWKVDLMPLQAKTPDGGTLEIEDRYALVRDKDQKVMTITGKHWKPLQNSDTLDFMRRYVEAGGAKMETAGALRGGKIVWGLARLTSSFEVSPGDRVNGYLLITSPHEVGKAITIRTTSVRVVCANTMALANSNSELNYSQSHVKEFDIATAKAHVEQAHENLARAERQAKILDGLKLTAEDAVKKVLVPTFAPEILREPELMDAIMQPDLMPRKIREIFDSVQNAPGGGLENGWGVLNGVTHWADHVAGRSKESRLYNAWLGGNAQKKLETEKRLMELAA